MPITVAKITEPVLLATGVRTTAGAGTGAGAVSGTGAGAVSGLGAGAVFTTGGGKGAGVISSSDKIIGCGKVAVSGSVSVTDSVSNAGKKSEISESVKTTLTVAAMRNAKKL